MSEWYFAYGANMASRVLSRRGVTALESHPARLDGHRLAFEEPGIPLLEPAFACVFPEPGAAVHGVAHRLAPPDLARLDRVEGLGYDRIAHPIEVPSFGTVEASFYEARRRVVGRRPSRRYVGLLLEGAREHGLPEEWLRRLGDEPTFYLPGWSGLSPHLMRAIERVLEARQRLRARLGADR